MSFKVYFSPGVKMLYDFQTDYDVEVSLYFRELVVVLLRPSVDVEAEVVDLVNYGSELLLQKPRAGAVVEDREPFSALAYFVYDPLGGGSGDGQLVDPAHGLPEFLAPIEDLGPVFQIVSLDFGAFFHR